MSIKKKRKKKKKRGSLFSNFHFLSYTLFSDKNCTRAETHGRLKQNALSWLPKK